VTVHTHTHTQLFFVTSRLSETTNFLVDVLLPKIGLPASGGGGSGGGSSGGSGSSSSSSNKERTAYYRLIGCMCYSGDYLCVLLRHFPTFWESASSEKVRACAINVSVSVSLAWLLTEWSTTIQSR